MRITSYDINLSDNKHPVLVKDRAFNYSGNTPDNPANIATLMRECYSLADKAEEHLYVIAHDVKMNPLGVFLLSKGTISKSLCSPREIMMRMLLCGASGMILIHNHPSQEVTPSEADIVSARKLKDVGNLMCVPLTDSIIVSRDDYYSFLEHSLLKEE